MLSKNLFNIMLHVIILVSEIENLTNKKNYISKILDDYDSLEGKLLDDKSKENIYDLVERLLEKN